MLSKQIEKEKSTLRLMVQMYCKHVHRSHASTAANPALAASLNHPNNPHSLCPTCLVLLQYAEKRLDQCRYAAHKKACKHCLTHCYKPALRQQIKEVMRWAGPRMLLYAPWTAIRHFLNR